MRRTKSPWFSRSSSGLISASQSVLRITRKAGRDKDNSNKSQQDEDAQGRKDPKFTIQSSKSHLGFLPDAGGSSSMLRLRRNNKDARTRANNVADRGQALPIATDDDDEINALVSPPRDEFASSGVLNFRRNNKDTNAARPPAGPKDAAPPKREEFPSSGKLTFRRNKDNSNDKAARPPAVPKDPTEFPSAGKLTFRRNRDNDNDTKSVPKDPTRDEPGSSGMLSLRRNGARLPVPSTAVPDVPVERSSSKKKIYAAKRNTRKGSQNKVSNSKSKDPKDPAQDSGSQGVLEMRLKRRREALKSNLDAKSSMDPTSESPTSQSQSTLEFRRSRVRDTEGKTKEPKAALDPMEIGNDTRHNSFGVLVRKQPPTPAANSSTRTESASSGGELISKPVVKILRGRKEPPRGSGFSSDRASSGPIQRTYSSSSKERSSRTRSGPIASSSSGTDSSTSSTSSRSNRTRSGPIASSGQRQSELDSQRELRLHRKKRNVVAAARTGINNTIITVPSGSDTSTSDDEPTSTPRNAGKSPQPTAVTGKVALPSPTAAPDNNDTNQSRAESMPHLRRRKYVENTDPDFDRPRVCPVIPELPTTKSFQNSSSPDAPPPLSPMNINPTTNHAAAYTGNEFTSRSMASLRRKNKQPKDSNSRNNSQFDSDRTGDTPIVPSTPPKSAFLGGPSHGGSSSMLRLRRLRHRKNDQQNNDNVRMDSDQTPTSPPSRYGLPSSKSTSRITSDPSAQHQHESHSMLRLRRTKRLHVDANPAKVSTADASPPPPLRYSHADLRISGWLTKKGKRLGTKVERLFTLRGCVLSNARGKGAKPSWSINVRGANVYGRSSREIVIALPKDVMSFFAPSAEAHARWIKALQAVSSCVFDFYDKGKRIGKGAYSEVFLGRDKIRNELCAIKVLQRPDADHGKLIDREISVLHLLNHANIVQIYDIFETTKTTYIVMEFLPGGELLDMITENDNLSELCAKHVIAQLLHAISYLHVKDIVHRDIKPDNILCVGRTWPLHVKLTDFGLSQVVSAADGGVMKSQCGTAFYLAPEIARNLDYGKPVDLWACGIVLYVMLAGKFPFYGDNHKEFIRRLRNGVKFPSKQWKNISNDAKDLIMCLLDPNPKSRLTADQALQHRWLVNDQEPKSSFGGPRAKSSTRKNYANYHAEFNHASELQSMPVVNFKSRRGYRDKSNRSSGLTARARVESIQDLPSFTTSVSTVGDPQSESMVF